MLFDTIVAKTTANGTSAINLIRVSGDESISIVNSIFSGVNLENKDSHTVHYGFIKNEKQEQIDEVLVSIFRSPKTFTTEDVVEITCHGGNFIANEIIKLLIANGARLAENGEFTKRAYLNGRLDLRTAK
jgi:tRNA modification GTPase